MLHRNGCHMEVCLLQEEEGWPVRREGERRLLFMSVPLNHPT